MRIIAFGSKWEFRPNEPHTKQRASKVQGTVLHVYRSFKTAVGTSPGALATKVTRRSLQAMVVAVGVVVMLRTR